MERVLSVVLPSATLLLLAAGCQTQNPFAAVGPATVPAPTTGQTLPYYPPTVTGAPAGSGSSIPSLAATAKSPRVSVSAEGPVSAPSRTIVADAADREPIRIVEGSSPAVRTANANARLAPTGIQAAPASAAPASSSRPPANRMPTMPPSGQSGYAPAATSPPRITPAASRMRGFAVQDDRVAGTSSIAPASYQQPVPTFSEATAADGQWRAR